MPVMRQRCKASDSRAVEPLPGEIPLGPTFLYVPRLLVPSPVEHKPDIVHGEHPPRHSHCARRPIIVV